MIFRAHALLRCNTNYLEQPFCQINECFITNNHNRKSQNNNSLLAPQLLLVCPSKAGLAKRVSNDSTLKILTKKFLNALQQVQPLVFQDN